MLYLIFISLTYNNLTLVRRGCALKYLVDNSDDGLIDVGTDEAGVVPGSNSSDNGKENDIQFAVLYAIDNLAFEIIKYFFIFIYFSMDMTFQKVFLYLV